MRALVLLMLLLPFLIGGCVQEQPKNCQQLIAEIPALIKAAQGGQPAHVARVIDGDTLILEDGRHVRLIGINAPEKNEHNYLTAKDALAALVANRTIYLERDVSDKDQYGRILRYVYTNDSFVNAQMVASGYAAVYFIQPNTKYQKLFECLQENAQASGAVIWKPSIYEIELIISPNPKGPDQENLNGEYVVLKNKGQAVNLAGWQLKDEARHIYTFPELELCAGCSLRVHTGCGQDNDTDLFWCSSQPIWNNAGDTAYLRDPEGRLVAEKSY